MLIGDGKSPTGSVVRGHNTVARGHNTVARELDTPPDLPAW